MRSGVIFCVFWSLLWGDFFWDCLFSKHTEGIWEGMFFGVWVTLLGNFREKIKFLEDFGLAFIHVLFWQPSFFWNALEFFFVLCCLLMIFLWYHVFCYLFCFQLVFMIYIFRFINDPFRSL